MTARRAFAYAVLAIPALVVLGVLVYAFAVSPLLLVGLPLAALIAWALGTVLEEDR